MSLDKAVKLSFLVHKMGKIRTKFKEINLNSFQCFVPYSMSDPDPHREVAQDLFSCRLRRKLKLRGFAHIPEMTQKGHLESYSHLILNSKCFSHRLCVFMNIRV